MRKLSTLVRWDKQSSSYISNQLGTFSYQSLADFENNVASSFVRTLTPSASRSGSAWNGAVAMGNSWIPARAHHVMFGLRGEGTMLEIGSYAPKVSELFGPSNRSVKDWHISPRIGYTTSIDTSGKWGRFHIGTGNFRGPIGVGAATCAHEQNMFSEAHDILFRLSDSIGIKPWESIFPSHLALNVQAFEGCIQDTVTYTKVLDARNLASRISVDGTPTFLINQYLYRGAIPTDSIRTIINKILVSQTAE